MDKDKRVIGKLSQLDFVRALERKNEQSEEIGDIGKFGFSSKAARRAMTLWALIVMVSIDLINFPELFWK